MTTHKGCRWHPAVQVPHLGRCPSCMLYGNPVSSTLGGVKTTMKWSLLAVAIATVAYYGYRAIMWAIALWDRTPAWALVLVAIIAIVWGLVILSRVR